MNPLPADLIADLQPLVGDVFKITNVSGGITNRNYKLDTSSGTYMLRLAGERTALLGIDRHAEFISSKLAFEAGVGAEPIAFLEQHGALLTRFLEDAITLDASGAVQQLEQIVKALQIIHAAPKFAKSFSAFQTMLEYYQLALQHGVIFPSDIQTILEELANLERRLEPSAVIVPCHNDLLPANLLLQQNKLFVVDWEYAGNGNRLFDLANLAANLELNTEAMQHLLFLYFGDAKELDSLHLMRRVSDAREAFWGFLQSGISSLEFDFLGYANLHLERFRAARGALHG